MAIIWKTTDPPFTSQFQGLQTYNGLDCCITLEVLHAIRPQLNEITGPVYDHARALQAPILEMEIRGIKVDQAARQKVIALYSRQVEQLNDQLEEILVEGLGLASVKRWDKPNNRWSYLWNSPKQLADLFYGSLGLPPVRKRGPGGGVTTDRGALEKLQSYFHVEAIIKHILAIRDLNKKLGVLRTGIDKDGRIRTSFNIAGTDTGRLASYVSSFGTGTNLQNITGELRNVFVADPGFRLAYIDLEQAESRAVGAIIWNLFQDGTYLDFCESGDLHTNVVKMVWPGMPWTGDPKKDKEIAKQPFYRHMDFRDGTKRLGHGSNYYGKPPHMAKQTHIPLPLVAEFQRQYFAAFHGIPKWHQWVIDKVRKDGFITTFMGRQRYFFGRRFDEETYRAAIAYEPQSVIGDYLNTGLLEVWRQSNAGTLPVQLLLQVHDAIVFQYPAANENDVIPRVQKCLELEVPLLHNRTLRIPTEAFVGWNWAYAYNQKKELVNPDGLLPFTGNDTRQRSSEIPLMDRRVS